MNKDIIWFDTMDSPIGTLELAIRDGGVVRVGFAEERHPHPHVGDWRRDPMRIQPLRAQLQEYFDGGRSDFDLDLIAIGTDFQRDVWRALARIPYAETISYGELARQIGNPKAVRAVGLANGRNPIPIIVPCHRVIGANGSLTGFGGGIERKRWLLDHESRIRPLLLV